MTALYRAGEMPARALRFMVPNLLSIQTVLHALQPPEALEVTSHVKGPDGAVAALTLAPSPGASLIPGASTA